MIARLRGVINEIGVGFAILDVGGVGYRVDCSERTLQSLPAVGEAANLLIETFSQEERIRLFGFGGEAERNWFLLLVGVQGIGARMALGILGVLAPDDLAHAIHEDDAKRLTCAHGVGTRLARRIVSELKYKTPPVETGTGAAKSETNRASATTSDAVAALVRLGYGRPQIHDALARVLQERGEAGKKMGLADLIRASLQLLAKAS